MKIAFTLVVTLVVIFNLIELSSQSERQVYYSGSGAGRGAGPSRAGHCETGRGGAGRGRGGNDSSDDKKPDLSRVTNLLYRKQAFLPGCGLSFRTVNRVITDTKGYYIPGEEKPVVPGVPFTVQYNSNDEVLGFEHGDNMVRLYYKGQWAAYYPQCEPRILEKHEYDYLKNHPRG